MFCHSYQHIISIENLLAAWQEFIRGKRKRKDVQEFELHLMDNIINLHHDLSNKVYRHALYEAFNISDPKPRNIHKATVRDRLLHHAIYRQLYPYFDQTFVADSFSCRENKGTHKALERFKSFYNKVSKNNTRTAWVLKSDIKRFFASIDQSILLNIIKRHIEDKDTVNLLTEIVESFKDGKEGKGLPLGNLTSQLLVNVYMNEFDQFMKHNLKAKYYIRYADDFVVLSDDKQWLEGVLVKMSEFVEDELKLSLHPKKTCITTYSSGVDFLGWTHFPHHRTLRTVTKKRMLNKMKEVNVKNATKQSYLGLLRHGDTYKLQKQIE